MWRGSSSRLSVLSLCVLFFHVISSIVHEAVFYIPGFHHIVLLTFVQSLCISLFATLQLYHSSPVTSLSPWRRLQPRRVPLRTYFMIALMNTTSIYLTNEVSRLLSYSTQVVFKSSKLLFVWLVRYIAIEHPAHFEAKGVLVPHDTEEVDMQQEPLCCTTPTKGDSSGISNEVDFVKAHLPRSVSRLSPKCHVLSSVGEGCHNNHGNGKHNDNSNNNRNCVIHCLSHAAMMHPKAMREAVSCIIVVLGLILFTCATRSTRVTKGTEEQDQRWWSVLMGIVGIVTAMLCDALMYLGEEKYCFMAHNAAHDEVQCYVFLFSTLNGLISLILSGGVGESLHFLNSHPVFVLILLLDSLCIHGGTFFLLRIISEFNSSTATVVTSVRKVITVLCSYVVYSKPFGVAHFAGLFLVVGGIWQYEVARRMHSSHPRAVVAKPEEEQ